MGAVVVVGGAQFIDSRGILWHFCVCGASVNVLSTGCTSSQCVKQARAQEIFDNVKLQGSWYVSRKVVKLTHMDQVTSSEGMLF